MLRRRLTAAVEPAGLTLPAYVALSVLRAQDGLSNAQLARRSLVTPQSMSEALTQLVDRGYVQRRADPDHGRIIRTELTPAEAGRSSAATAPSTTSTGDARRPRRRRGRKPSRRADPLQPGLERDPERAAARRASGPISSEIVSAVRLTAGPYLSIRSSIETIDRWTARLSAATTSPELERIGAAIDRSPYASSSLLTATPIVLDPLHLGAKSDAISDRVGTARHQLHAVEDLLEPVLGDEREQRLPHRGAIGRQAGADVEVQIDLPLSRPRGPAALDVDDVAAVENRQVGGEAGRIAQSLQVRDGDLADVHRVDRGEAQVENARAEPVALGLRVLLEVAERRQRRDVAMGGAPAQPSSRESSLTPIVDLSEPKAERIARPRSRDCDHVACRVESVDVTDQRS